MSENEQESAAKPEVEFSGANGNVYNLIGLCHVAARRAGWSSEQWEKVRTEMMSGDYDHVIQTAMKYFEVG